MKSTAMQRQSAHPKLEKVLNLLGSPVDGEALQAARTAVTYLRKRDLEWSDVLESTSKEASQPSGEGLLRLFDPKTVRETGRAVLLDVLLSNGKRREIWIPLSQIRWTDNGICLTSWIYTKKNDEIWDLGIDAVLETAEEI